MANPTISDFISWLVGQKYNIRIKTDKWAYANVVSLMYGPWSWRCKFFSSHMLKAKFSDLNLCVNMEIDPVCYLGIVLQDPGV